MTRRGRIQVGLAVAAMLFGTMVVRPAAHGFQRGFEFWSSCTSLPDFADVEFLPIFTDSETPGFVDLGSLAVHRNGLKWKALQFTRDKAFDITVPAGKWLFGLLGDEWPAGTVDVIQELRSGRLESIEVDGWNFWIRPDCLLDLSSEEGTFAMYVVLPKFTKPGYHSLKYRWAQRRSFFFIYPYAALGTTDPFGLDGRRVFLGGETVGNRLDGQMVLKYRVLAQ
jgi:hypothetical protein